MLSIENNKYFKYPSSLNDYTNKYNIENKQQNFPLVKLPAEKFNMYKYQKSFYRITQFEKLFLSSKHGIKPHHEHQN